MGLLAVFLLCQCILEHRGKKRVGTSSGACAGTSAVTRHHWTMTRRYLWKAFSSCLSAARRMSGLHFAVWRPCCPEHNFVSQQDYEEDEEEADDDDDFDGEEDDDDEEEYEQRESIFFLFFSFLNFETTDVGTPHMHLTKITTSLSSVVVGHTAAKRPRRAAAAAEDDEEDEDEDDDE